MVKDVLRRKLVRDMWHNRMQFLAVILLCALGTWVFSGLDAAWRMLDLSAQTYFDEQNVADVWITLSSADREAMERVRGIVGVEDAQARAGLYAFCQLGLIDYTPSPLRYAIRPAVKCSLGDSPMLAALRALGADNTTMERDDAVE